jgi:cytochrome c5
LHRDRPRSATIEDVKVISRNAVLFAAPVAAAAFVTALAANAGAQQGNRGEQILNSACSSCHDLRPIQTSAHDKEGWNDVVQNMLQKGADVSDADVPVLVNYLVEAHGPMPDGRGKDVVLNICTMCHDLARIRNGRRSPEEWQETLNSMLNEGAPLSDQDYPTVLGYLAKNFGQ